MKYLKKFKNYVSLNEGVQTESLIRFISDAFFKYSEDKVWNSSYNDVRVQYKMMTILNRYLKYDDVEDYIKDFIRKFKEIIKRDDLSPVISFELERPFNVRTYQIESTEPNPLGGYDFHGDKSIYIHVYEFSETSEDVIKPTLNHEVKHFVDDILSDGKHLGKQDDLDYWSRPYEINARLSSFYSNMDTKKSFEEIKMEMMFQIRPNVWTELSNKEKQRYIKMTYKMYQSLKEDGKLYNATIKTKHDRVSKKKTPVVISSDSLTNDDNEKVLIQLEKDLDKSFLPMLKKYKIDYEKSTVSSPHIITLKNTLTDLVYFNIETGEIIYPLFKLVVKALQKGYVILIPHITPDQLVKFEESYTEYYIKEISHKKREVEIDDRGYRYSIDRVKKYWLISKDETPNIPRSFNVDGGFNSNEYSNEKAVSDAKNTIKQVKKSDKTYIDFSISNRTKNFNDTVIRNGDDYIKIYLQTLIDSKMPVNIVLPDSKAHILKSLKYKGKFVSTSNSLCLKPLKGIYSGNLEQLMWLISKKENNLETNILTYESMAKSPKYVKELGIKIFEYARKIGNLELIKLLLKNGLNLDDIKLSNCFSGTSSKASYDIVKFLIEKGVDVNKVSSIGGWSPLLNASYIGNVEIVKLLLDNGADPNFTTKDEYKNTAIFLAKKPEIIQMLKDAGATE